MEELYVLWFLTYVGTLGAKQQLGSEIGIVPEELGLYGHHVYSVTEGVPG